MSAAATGAHPRGRQRGGRAQAMKRGGGKFLTPQLCAASGIQLSNATRSVSLPSHPQDQCATFLRLALGVRGVYSRRTVLLLCSRSPLVARLPLPCASELSAAPPLLFPRLWRSFSSSSELAQVRALDKHTAPPSVALPPARLFLLVLPYWRPRRRCSSSLHRCSMSASGVTPAGLFSLIFSSVRLSPSRQSLMTPTNSEHSLLFSSILL